ncbi:MAG: iron-sulfur cluster repair di-iron protein [Saprospiraceae bacterium]|jgi:regulator of cell morphogenesis and NO signaling|nr:iron-sulfur cluster repair di-iron protein [Saprospiraceae bacterium]
MNINNHSVIGDIVAQNFKTAEVFRSYGVDFCCKGNRALDDLAKSENLDISKLIMELESMSATNGNTSIDFKSWPLDLLADYIEKTYHRYIEEKTPIINEYLTKICKVHGHRHPELHAIHEIFLSSTSDLFSHMQKEEKILFPYIRQMVADDRNKVVYRAPGFGSIKNPINMMMEEHLTEGDRYREISTLSNIYTPPADACNTYLVTYGMLNEFELKLHEHIHLENNILFPSAIKFEEILANKLN